MALVKDASVGTVPKNLRTLVLHTPLVGELKTQGPVGYDIEVGNVGIRMLCDPFLNPIKGHGRNAAARAVLKDKDSAPKKTEAAKVVKAGDRN